VRDSFSRGVLKAEQHGEHRHNKRKDMNKTRALLTIAATLIATNLTLSAYAGDVFLSPRGHANQIRVVPGVAKDVDLAHNLSYGNAKARELAYSTRTVPTVPSIGPRIDIAHRPLPALSPKDPQFANVMRAAMQSSQTQIAPLK
jgi:hypothetical protein